MTRFCSSRRNTTARCRASSRTRSMSGRAPTGRALRRQASAPSCCVSPGAIGGRARRQSAFAAGPDLPQRHHPACSSREVYVGGAGALFDDKGELTNDKTREFLAKLLASFAALVGKLKAWTFGDIRPINRPVTRLAHRRPMVSVRDSTIVTGIAPLRHGGADWLAISG